MYTASNAFHAAVRNNNPQKMMLMFPENVFTNEDIDIDTGVELKDSFNLEEDLAIGQALSNELNFAIFNDDGDLDDFEFGEFTATLGVQLTNLPYTETGNCSAVIGRDVYVGRNSSPYITKNGTAMPSQPSFPVKCIVVMDDTVYAMGQNGQCRKWVNNVASSYTPSNFMKRKLLKHLGCGYAYNSQTRILTERGGGREKMYEFVPWGIFQADRPNVPDVIRIAFSCNDRMMRFDKDMPTKEDLGITYPTTISNLFVKLCEYFEVPYATSTFINSGAEIAKEPEEFENATARTVIGWIAEAAGSNAVFDRDGRLVFRWIQSTGTYVDESGYMEFQPYWYETPQINKLLNRDTKGTEEKSHGSGTTAYLIQDNPLLKGFE